MIEDMQIYHNLAIKREFFVLMIRSTAIKTFKNIQLLITLRQRK